MAAVRIAEGHVVDRSAGWLAGRHRGGVVRRMVVVHYMRGAELMVVWGDGDDRWSMRSSDGGRYSRVRERRGKVVGMCGGSGSGPAPGSHGDGDRRRRNRILGLLGLQRW